MKWQLFRKLESDQNKWQIKFVLLYQLTTKLEIYNVSIAIQLSRVGFKCI